MIFLISLLVTAFQKSVWECSVHSCSCPCLYQHLCSASISKIGIYEWYFLSICPFCKWHLGTQEMIPPEFRKNKKDDRNTKYCLPTQLQVASEVTGPVMYFLSLQKSFNSNKYLVCNIRFLLSRFCVSSSTLIIFHKKRLNKKQF